MTAGHGRARHSGTPQARRVNPKVAGWINYYGRFRPWELIPFLMRINAYLVRWIRKKYKRLAAKRKALAKLQEIAQRYPRMFAHWRLTPRTSAVQIDLPATPTGPATAAPQHSAGSVRTARVHVTDDDQPRQSRAQHHRAAFRRASR